MLVTLPVFVQFIFGLASGAALMLVVVSLQQRAAVVKAETVMPPPKPGPWLAGVVLMGGFAALEEWLFRGLLLSWLMPLAGASAAVLFSSILFGLLHWPNTRHYLATFNAGLTGITFSLAVLGTGSLALAVGLHAGWNFIQWNVMGYPLYGLEEKIGTVFPAPLRLRARGRPLASGGAFGPEACLYTTLVWLAAPFIIIAVT